MKIAKKFFDKFNSLNLYKKIFSVNMIIVFAFICLFGIAQYFSVRKHVMEQHNYSISHNHKQTCSLIASLIADYSTAINTLEQEKLVDEFIRIHSFDETDTENVLKEYERYREFIITVESILASANIDKYSIYTKDGYMYADDAREIFQSSDMQNTEWYKAMTESQSKVMYFDSSYFTEKEKAGDDYVYCVGLVYSNEDYEDYVGAIRLGISKKRIEEILHESIIISDSSSAIYSNNGSVIASVGTDNSEICEAYKEVNANRGEGLISFSCNNKRYVASKQSIPFTDWELIDLLPLSVILSSYYTLSWKLFGGIILIFVLILVVINKVFISYTKRLNILVDTMAMYKEGNLTIIEENEIHDDIGMCIDAYNLMATNIQQMFRQQIETSEKLHSYDMQILYERVNPHFLYNTLEIINSMAQEHGIDSISKSVQSLAEYYKISLNNAEPVLTLDKELRHCELYMEICNKRYDKNVVFCSEVPDEFLDIEVPKMILQPIIENSIRHGFVGEREYEDNEIIVAAYMRGDYVDIEITDSGVGISEDKLKEINKMEMHSNGIGLRNTNERIKLYYGEDCGVKVFSEPGSYTTVVIRVKK